MELENKRKEILQFTLKFLLLFGVFYYGTIAWIGLASPGKYYVPFIQHYLDFVSWIRYSLMSGAAQVAHLFGFATQFEPNFTLRVVGARGVIIAYDCVGYGVMSFWLAYVLMNPGNWKKKLIWSFGGCLLLWLINVLRIGLFLVAINKKWPMPLGLDHHTWFNIVAYGAIFAMMYFFDRGKHWKLKSKKSPTTNNKP